MLASCRGQYDVRRLGAEELLAVAVAQGGQRLHVDHIAHRRDRRHQAPRFEPGGLHARETLPLVIQAYRRHTADEQDRRVVVVIRLFVLVVVVDLVFVFVEAGDGADERRPRVAERRGGRPLAAVESGNGGEHGRDSQPAPRARGPSAHGARSAKVMAATSKPAAPTTGRSTMSS